MSTGIHYTPRNILKDDYSILKIDDKCARFIADLEFQINELRREASHASSKADILKNILDKFEQEVMG